ncbi:MAG: hypothetical protein PHH14_00145 [Candidatus Margulisbacteria bacterium]|nr:hypothetical protein [Candidatus Margulisiibacteriota bacterium]
MNPVAKFNINNFKEVVREIEENGDISYLRLLENRVIHDIIKLIEKNTKEAKAELSKLELIVNEDLGFTPRNGLLVSALRNSIKGALAAAKLYLF